MGYSLFMLGGFVEGGSISMRQSRIMTAPSMLRWRRGLARMLR